ncbi:hypothetical protein ACVIGB_000619 [Bradyrhizobium sp. USDA 4341]
MNEASRWTQLLLSISRVAEVALLNTFLSLALAVVPARAQTSEATVCHQRIVDCLKSCEQAEQFFSDRNIAFKHPSSSCGCDVRGAIKEGRYCFSIDSRYSAEFRDILNARGIHTHDD